VSAAGKSAKALATVAADPSPPCDCDNTGVCTCAIPRVTPSRKPNLQRQSSQSTSTTEKSSTIERRASIGASSSDSSLGSSKATGYSTDQSSSTSNCCSNKPTSIDPTLTTPAVPTISPTLTDPLTHFNPQQYQPDNFNSILSSDPLWFDVAGTQQSLRSNRYTPYPQPNYSNPSQLVSRPAPAVQAPISDPTYDAKTVALWEEFLRDDDLSSTQPSTLPIETANPQPLSQNNLELLSKKTHDPLQPPPNCVCVDGSVCSACSPESITSLTSIETPACDTATTANLFNCDTMMQAILALKDELGIKGDVCPHAYAAAAAVAAVESSKQTSTPLVSKDLFPELAKSYPSYQELAKSFPELSKSFPELSKSLSQQYETLTSLSSLQNPSQLPPIPSSDTAINGCTCGPACTCFICSGNNGTDLTYPGKQECKSCSSCPSCSAFSQTLAEIPPALPELLAEPFIY
jgi:hypothetical protein